MSVKNRSNTLGGQDWPKAIQALEQVARTDRNRDGPYICVFGIAMEKGPRRIKVIGRTKPHTLSTQNLSDFFWPFFANYSYEEIVSEVLHTLRRPARPTLRLQASHCLKSCWKPLANVGRYSLLDSDGRFNDADRLVQLFCGIR